MINYNKLLKYLDNRLIKELFVLLFLFYICLSSLTFSL